MKFQKIRTALAGAAGLFIVPMVALADLEGNLRNVQSKLIGTILPLMGIFGLAFAAFSFFTGSQNARTHLILAIVGAVVGFGAPSIIQFLQSIIH